jgi:hypothetical protein
MTYSERQGCAARSMAIAAFLAALEGDGRILVET